MPEYETKEGVGAVSGGAKTVEEARALHHLATADPEPERDGTMTGPAHEAKYGLERAKASAAIWRAHGVHPTENRALVGDEDGAENLRGVSAATVDGALGLETTRASAPKENTASPKAK